MKNVITERMTINDSCHKMHKTSFIFMVCVMSWLWRRHVSLMHTPSSKVLSYSVFNIKFIFTKCIYHYISEDSVADLAPLWTKPSFFKTRQNKKTENYIWATIT